MKLSLWIIAALATIAILFYSVESWRGASAREDTRAYLEEQGETFDFSALWPEPAPPEENFCAIPLLASLTDFTVPEAGGDLEYHDPETRDRFLKIRLPDASGENLPPRLPQAGEAQKLDLKAWAAFLNAAEGFEIGDAGAPPGMQIRTALARFDPEFSEIAAAAASRPRAWFPVSLGDDFIEAVSTPLPYLTDLMGFSKFLTLKGAAAVATGDSMTARECIRIQLRLSEAIGAQPTLIHHLVEISMLSQTTVIVREGLLSRTWSEADLEWIAGRLDAIPLYENAANALRGEMIGFFLAGTEYLKSGNPEDWALITGGSSATLQTVGLRLVPDGWFDQNAAIGCNFFYHHGILPLKNRDFSRLGEDPFSEEFESVTPYNFLVKVMAPATRRVIRRSVQTQAMLDAERVACALELHHLKHRNYPDSLEILVPEFLSSVPEDPITGGPLSFRRGENGYRIYSVGLNGKDEGGALFRKENGRVDRDKGDWVFSCERSG